jgi:serine/threonine protein kinase
VKIPVINFQESLPVKAGVSKLSKVEFARNSCPALLKEPRNFWDEIFIANEAYVLDEITHPRIRRRLAYEAESHRLFLEYVEASTLTDLVQAGLTVQNPGRTHKILQCVAETVADMHAGILCARPVIHNDLKSMNVLVPTASPAEAILIDLSHSYFAGCLPPFIADKKQNPVGTAKYMAPEKWDGDHTNGFKGDVFAFGVMAYYACTGRHPFEAEAAMIEKQIRETTPPSPIQLGFDVLRNTSVIIMACLNKMPDQRPSMENIARCYADSASLFRQAKQRNFAT